MAKEEYEIQLGLLIEELRNITRLLSLFYARQYISNSTVVNGGTKWIKDMAKRLFGEEVFESEIESEVVD